MNQKQLLKEKLSAFEKKSHNRFELTEKFLKANIHMVELANKKTNEEILHLFKKVGSNFKIVNRAVLFEPRSTWRTLSDSGFFGGIQSRRHFVPTIFLLPNPILFFGGEGGI